MPTFDPKGSKTSSVLKEREKIPVLNLDGVNGFLFTRRKEEKEQKEEREREKENGIVLTERSGGGRGILTETGELIWPLWHLKWKHN